ncbi:hypothetical protein [Pseudomonas urmiensis]|jgi:hypothetical protein|uniref:Uncharacterized protein n=1 Tax=Pseudomonas urmiensis TaxID=2745493 RepID=A0A923JUP9_9PSED|nr:hypothetical protein [Pseudomonas urmiensis]MBV4536868.1 hypothetical protein [Pseudomonas urmiensis]
MSDKDELEHHDDDRLCENDDGAIATVLRNGKWICTDCDTRGSGTSDLND